MSTNLKSINSPSALLLEKGKLESELVALGNNVVGVDEVGRGCIAGPVVTSCVLLDFARLFSINQKYLRLIRDSKTLSSAQRNSILPVITDVSLETAIGIASTSEIEELGISNATFLAMRRAINKVSHRIDMVLVDGNQLIPGLEIAQQAVVKGDSSCFSIAAASIVAKEFRDSYMRDQALSYPDFGFSSHMGYGTKDHLTAISKFGICPLHRKNFAPIRDQLTLQS